MKGVKKLFGVLIGIICALFLITDNVKAVDIDSQKSLKEAFEGKSAIINENNITLTGDIEFKNPSYDVNAVEGTGVSEYEPFNLSKEVYTLNLNGYKFTANEINIKSGSLNINDSTGKGVIDLVDLGDLIVFENASLVFNNGKLKSLNNDGSAVINNGIIDTINNHGTLLIEDGKFGSLCQLGNARINGGIFTSYEVDGEEKVSFFDLDNGTTIMTGGEFETSNANSALIVTGGNDGDIVRQLAEDGYIAIYNGYWHSSDGWSYSSIKIIKDEAKEIFNKIIPTEVWKVNALKPQDIGTAEFVLTAVAGDFELPKGYKIYVWCEGDEDGNFNPNVANIDLYYKGCHVCSKIVEVVYNEPSSKVVEEVNSVISKIEEYTEREHSIEKSFRLEDLHLINYLYASSKGIDASLALNFSKDLIEITKGGNISYKFDARLGDAPSNGLWHFGGGGAIVYYDGFAVDTTTAGLTTNHVLYVPLDTLDNDEARIAAALRRIGDYLGSTKGIAIEVGGTLESLNYYDEYEERIISWNDKGFIDETTSGSNYYNLTINGQTYRFTICRKDISDFKKPEYLACDILSKIFIKSSSTELPLDTAIKVISVVSDKIKKLLGTEIYAAYDISLFSNAKQVNITKLENGNFVVSVPVPEKLKNKELIVYYINDKNEKVAHAVTIKDGVSSFETNHFSTYALAENSSENVPQTFDGITNSVLVATISLFGLVSAIYLQKKQNRA